MNHNYYCLHTYCLHIYIYIYIYIYIVYIYIYIYIYIYDRLVQTYYYVFLFKKNTHETIIYVINIEVKI